MRIVRAINGHAAALLMTMGLIAAPFAAFSHDCSTCPAPCCSQQESGCCGDRTASCAGHPLCDECAVLSSQNAVPAGTGCDGFARSHCTVKYPVHAFLKQAAAYRSGHTLSTDFFRAVIHAPPHISSTVLRS